MHTCDLGKWTLLKLEANIIIYLPLKVGRKKELGPDVSRVDGVK